MDWDLEDLEPLVFTTSDPALVDMRGESDQLHPCNAANCHRDQARCVGYEKVRGSDRCLHLRCEEFCLR